MADTPIDPLTLIHGLVSAWNRNVPGEAQPPVAPIASPDNGNAEIIARLALIE